MVPRLNLQVSPWHSQAPYVLQDKEDSDVRQGPETPERALRLEAPGAQWAAAGVKHGTPGQDTEGPPRRNLPPKIELLL